LCGRFRGSSAPREHPHGLANIGLAHDVPVTLMATFSDTYGQSCGQQYVSDRGSAYPGALPPGKLDTTAGVGARQTQAAPAADRQLECGPSA